MDPLMRLKAGIDQAEVVFGQIRPDQYSSPTPCPDWNVEQVMNHMVGALVMFRDVATQGSADPSSYPSDLIGDDAARSLRQAGDAAVAGWGVPGKLEGPANMPWGEMPAAFALQLPAMDMLVHSWDLVRATGLQVDFNPELVADNYEFVTTSMADPVMRGDDFAPPVDIEDDAPELSKVVAFLGRKP